MNRLYITPIGDVLVCPYVHIKIGNIFKQSLREIVDFGFRIKHFRNHSDLCLAGEDKNFISKFMTKSGVSFFNPALAERLFLKKIFLLVKYLMLLKNKDCSCNRANKGIGLEILKSFSANGSKKIFACIRELNSENIKKFESIQKEFNNQIIPIKIDFSKTELIKEAYNNILSHESPIDILVNNAGAISTSLTQMTTMKNYQYIFQINVFGQIQFIKALLKK